MAMNYNYWNHLLDPTLFIPNPLLISKCERCSLPRLYMFSFGGFKLILSIRVQTCFHGVDLSSMRDAAMKEYFRQPIVDTFDVRICMSKSIRHSVDFSTAKETDLHRIGKTIAPLVGTYFILFIYFLLIMSV